MNAERSAMALGIACGEFQFAIAYKWVGKMVDDFEMVAVPRSPPWLGGLANIDGAMVPVVDLAEFFGSSALPDAGAHAQPRLLVGTHERDQQVGAIGFLFTGLPSQFPHATQPLIASAMLPERLREVCMGEIADAGGRKFLALDVDALSEALLAAV